MGHKHKVIFAPSASRIAPAASTKGFCSALLAQHPTPSPTRDAHTVIRCIPSPEHTGWPRRQAAAPARKSQPQQQKKNKPQSTSVRAEQEKLWDVLQGTTPGREPKRHHCAFVLLETALRLLGVGVQGGSPRTAFPKPCSSLGHQEQRRRGPSRHETIVVLQLLHPQISQSTDQSSSGASRARRAST